MEVILKKLDICFAFHFAFRMSSIVALNNFCRLFFFSVLLTGCFSFSQNVSTSVLNDMISTNSQRSPKWIPIVSYVRFQNSECVADDLRNGTCYNFHECKKLKGTPVGKCASNLGTCCVFQSTCGGKVTADNGHFVNPSYPSKDAKLPDPCTVLIMIPAGSCQVLLRMLEFNISQPDHDTVCKTDKMWFSQHPQIPTICGSNYEQHMFIDVDGISVLKLFMNSKGTKFQRIWNIKVSFLSCTSSGLAPVGCLQYFPQTSGTVSSFNYYEIKEFNYEYEEYDDVLDPPCTTHLANQNYAVCVQKARGMCQIEWTAETFEITGNETCAVAERGDICQNDYVMIPKGRINGDKKTYDRYCGFALNTAGSSKSTSVTSDALPFMIRFVTDGSEEDGEVTRGFKMQFRQIRCGDC